MQLLTRDEVQIRVAETQSSLNSFQGTAGAGEQLNDAYVWYQDKLLVSLYCYVLAT
jgi:hypothetical protein